MLKAKYCVGIVILSFITTVAIISKDYVLKEKKLEGTITKVEKGMGTDKKREGNRIYEIHKEMDILTVKTKKGEYYVYHDVKDNFKKGEKVNVAVGINKEARLVE